MVISGASEFVSSCSYVMLFGGESEGGSVENIGRGYLGLF